MPKIKQEKPAYRVDWDNLRNIQSSPVSYECPIMVIVTPQTSIEPHYHNFYEFVYVQEGFCLHFTDDSGSLLMTGDFLIIPPGVKHYYRCKSDIRIVNILSLPEFLGKDINEAFNLLSLPDFIENSLNSIFHASLSLPNREKVKLLINALEEEQNRKLSGWQLQSKAFLIELIVTVSRIFSSHFSQRSYKNSYMNNILSIMALIETRYAEDININDIATSFGISHEHFTRQFKQIVGFAPIEYLRRRRFAKALELLHTDKSVGEIAQKTGFGQIQYFSREFKKLFNITPTKFQKQCHENNYYNT